MIDQRVGRCLGALSRIVLAAEDKGMGIDEKSLVWIGVVLLRVCRHGAQVATWGQTRMRVFLGLAHQTAEGNLCCEKGQKVDPRAHDDTEDAERRWTACARAEERCATRNTNEGDPTRVRTAHYDSRDKTQEESVSGRLTGRSSDGDGIQAHLTLPREDR